MKKYFSLLAIILLTGLFIFCQKKLFKKVHVKGRMVHYFTNEPLRGMRVDLRADDATSAKNSQENILIYSSVLTNDGGYFDMKTRASKRNTYYIRIYDDPNETAKDIFDGISLNEHGTNDFGELRAGAQTFNCKVKIVPVSNSSITFYISNGSGPSKTVSFQAGTSTQYIYTATYDKDTYEGTSHKFFVQYYTIKSGIQTFSNVSIPITSADTLSCTIQY